MWNDLSMRERAAFIRAGVKNGIYNTDDIRNAYNRLNNDISILYKDGGILDKAHEQTKSPITKEELDSKRNAINQALYSTVHEIASYIPYIGSIMDAKDVAASINDKKYEEAAAIASSMLIPKIIRKPLSSISKVVSKPVTKWLDKKYKSSYKWDESWFKDHHNTNYTKEDVNILNSHIDELKHIERLSKKHKTFPVDYNGDPREWIMLQTKNAKSLDKEPIYSGIRSADFNPSYKGEVWGSKNPVIGQTYTDVNKPLLKLYYPKKARVLEHDAKGQHWGYIKYKDDVLTSDMIKDDLISRGASVVKLRNIIDPGPNIKGLRPNDYLSPSTDIIIKEKVPRKSILGNNGNFDFNDYNIFRKYGGILNIK